jgi:hypothetical protein
MAVDFLKARPVYDFGLPIRQVDENLVVIETV